MEVSEAFRFFSPEIRLLKPASLVRSSSVVSRTANGCVENGKFLALGLIRLLKSPKGARHSPILNCPFFILSLNPDGFGIGFHGSSNALSNLKVLKVLVLHLELELPEDKMIGDNSMTGTVSFVFLGVDGPATGSLAFCVDVMNTLWPHRAWLGTALKPNPRHWCFPHGLCLFLPRSKLEDLLAVAVKLQHRQSPPVQIRLVGLLSLTSSLPVIATLGFPRFLFEAPTVSCGVLASTLK